MKIQRTPAATKPEPIRCTLDTAAVIFDGDRILRCQILESRRIAKAQREQEAMLADEPGAKDQGRSELLKRAVRLTRTLTPSVWKCLDRCQEKLGVDAELEIFCEPDAIGNASVIKPRDGRVTMSVTSGALELLDDDELTSVFGHELGHAIFGHHELRPLMDFPSAEDLAPIDSMRIYAWMRYAELSADRVGLIACGDLDAAVRAEFKLSSGLGQPRYLKNTREAVTQLAALAEEDIERCEDDWFSTHPYSPLRLRAIDLFARSTTYAKLSGTGQGSVSERDMEREVASIMELMNPSCLSERLASGAEIRELLVLAGVAVAMADAKVKKSEVDLLDRLAKGLDVKAAFAADPEKAEARLRELAARLKVMLPLLRRQKIVEDLVSIALADGSVAPEEHETLSAIAELLDVDAFFVDDCLQRPEFALD